MFGQAEDNLAVITALGDVMGNGRKDNSRTTGNKDAVGEAVDFLA